MAQSICKYGEQIRRCGRNGTVDYLAIPKKNTERLPLTGAASDYLVLMTD
jgi:hypothetical protein